MKLRVRRQWPGGAGRREFREKFDLRDLPVSEGLTLHDRWERSDMPFGEFQKFGSDYEEEGGKRKVAERVVPLETSWE